jgi:hypothetical protein
MPADLGRDQDDRERQNQRGDGIHVMDFHIIATNITSRRSKIEGGTSRCLSVGRLGATLKR